MADINLQSGVKGDMNSTQASSGAGTALLTNSTPDKIMPDITHIANTETLQGFYNSHTIVKGTFPWSTSDQVGKILFSFPNHPGECNWLVDYIQKIFIGWAGHMEFDVRILGTAFMGGSLAFILVPPTYTRAQALAMSREDVSVFDYVEVDPKDISTMNFSLKDFRAEHFHFEPFNDSNPRSFGGWIICMVWGKLNISPNVEGASLDVLVRTKGAYTFRQPRPVTAAGIPIDSNFANFTTTRLNQMIGCDDGVKFLGTTFKTFPNRIEELWNGFIYAVNPTKATTDNTIDEYILPLNSDVTLLTDWPAEPKSEYIKLGSLYQREKLQPRSDYLIATLDRTQGKDVHGIGTHGGNLPAMNITDAAHVNATNAERGEIPMDTGLFMRMFVYKEDGGAHSGATPRVNTDGSLEIWYHDVNEPPTLYPSDAAHQTVFGFKPEEASSMLRFAYVPEGIQRIQKRVPADEKLIFFSSNTYGTVSAQTTAFANDVRAFEWPTGNSAIFAVLDRDQTIIAYMRISSAGFATTRGDFSVPPGVNDYILFRFVQWLPDNSTMPQNPATYKMTSMIQKQKDEIKILKSQMRLLLNTAK